jgi:hypothetical protein
MVCGYRLRLLIIGTRKAHVNASERAQQYLNDVCAQQRHTPSVTNDQVRTNTL